MYGVFVVHLLSFILNLSIRLFLVISALICGVCLVWYGGVWCGVLGVVMLSNGVSYGV